jgi:hypothetical protein
MEHYIELHKISSNAGELDVNAKYARWGNIWTGWMITVQKYW